MLETSKFIPSHGIPGIGWSRTFVGPDGKSYKWKMGLITSILELDDGSKPPTVVAHFHQKNTFKGTGAALELFPVGEHMLDVIVITWTYVESRRRDQERKHCGT